MDLVQQLLQIFHVYQDNSELIATAVKDLQQIGDSGFSRLKHGLEERKRKHILKAIALLAPSNIPAKVLEIDGPDDAELVLCESSGWIKTAFALYLRHDSLAKSTSTACSALLGGAVGFYTHSILAAIWDHVELGDEGLTDAEKPTIYQCSETGRQVFENARRMCLGSFSSPSPSAVSYKILAFEAARDEHRRFSVLSAVMIQSDTGQVLVVSRDKVLTLESYTLDITKAGGLEYCVSGLGDIEHQEAVWSTLNVLCSMFAEVHNESNAVKLIESMLNYLATGLSMARRNLETWATNPPVTLIPSRKDLKDIHNRNNENVRNRIQRQFTIRDNMFSSIRDAHTRADDVSPTEKSFALKCLADRHIYDLGKRLTHYYQTQTVLPVQHRETGSSSAFATYIYRSLERTVVAEEYRNIFSSGKVNIRQAKSGTLVFVPHSGIVTMTTYGMICKRIEVTNSQVFDYNSADRFALLPHLIALLGLREDDALLSNLVREMDENAYLVADPMTADVRACMTRSFETSQRVFRVSTLHEDARRMVGSDNYQGLVREAVSLLARLGASVPSEYVDRSCFYDITRELKGYRGQSTQMRILFDRGVVLDGLGCTVSVSGSNIIARLNVAVRDGHVIAVFSRNHLRPHRPTKEENDEEFQAMRAAIEAAGLKFMSASYDIHGEIRLAVTRSDPGNGLFCMFDGCEAR